MSVGADVSVDGVVRVCVFFFQAEDGIRDVAVTGVQTCALPISELPLSGTGFWFCDRSPQTARSLFLRHAWLSPGGYRYFRCRHWVFSADFGRKRLNG